MRRTVAACRSFSCMSPWTLRMRNDDSPLSNALVMMYIMKMMSADATSISTSVNPARRRSAGRLVMVSHLRPPLAG